VVSAVGRTARGVREFVAAHGLPIIGKPVRESHLFRCSLIMLDVRLG
jgi:hypothetical protein